MYLFGNGIDDKIKGILLVFQITCFGASKCGKEQVTDCNPGLIQISKWSGAASERQLSSVDGAGDETQARFGANICKHG